MDRLAARGRRFAFQDQRNIDHDTQTARVGGPGPSAAGQGADRLGRPPLVRHRRHCLCQASQGPGVRAAGRSASTIRCSNWRSSTTTCSTGSRLIRSSWAGRSRSRTATGPTGRCPTARPAKCRPGRCPSGDAGQWVLRSPSGRVLARMPDGAIYFEQCYWPYLDNDDLDRLPEALGENMWGGVPQPAGPAGGRAGRRAGAGRRGPAAAAADRPGDHRAVRRQSAGDRPIPLPQRQLLHAAGRKSPPGTRVSRPAGRNPSGQPGAVPPARSARIST